MERNEFYYYMHKTKIENSDIIESLFNEGLKSRHGYSINATLVKIDDEELNTKNLQQILIDYIGKDDNYNSVVLLKIPKRYLRYPNNNGAYDPAIPIFKEHHEEGHEWNSLIDNNFVQGVYCKDLDMAFTNPNFCPIFEPNGCQFADEQIENFKATRSDDWLKLAESRKSFDLKSLQSSDKNNKTWNQIVDHYIKLYNTELMPTYIYVMPKSERDEFTNIWH